MENRDQLIRKQALQLLDLALVFVCVFLTFPLRNFLVPFVESFNLFQIEDPGGVSPSDMAPSVYGLIMLVPLFLEKTGFYQDLDRVSLFDTVVKVFKSVLILLACFALLALVFNYDSQNRSVLAVLSGLIIVSLSLRQLILKSYYRQSSSRTLSSLLVVGSSQAVEEWLEEVPSDQRKEFRLVGGFDLQKDSIASFIQLLSEESVDRVIFITRKTPLNLLSEAVEVCELMGIESCIAADFINTSIASPSFDIVINQPMLIIKPTPSLTWSMIIKKLMDRLGSAVLIIVTLPLWIFCAIGILIADGRPVFYRQDRAGRYGKPFKMWKFRSMSRNAEAELDLLKSEQGNEMNGPVFKLKEDPRVFKFGSFLRRTSLDELPQLINVLVGELSLVGPRPMACYEIPEIEESAHRRKMSVKPGITCIWQVEGRNTITDFEEWVKLDLKYIDEWSLWLDIKILFRTIPAVLFSRGAK